LAVVVGEGSSKLSILSRGYHLSLLDKLLETGEGSGTLMFHLGFALLDLFFGLLGHGPSILFLVFPLFWVLWFIFD